MKNADDRCMLAQVFHKDMQGTPFLDYQADQMVGGSQKLLVNAGASKIEIYMSLFFDAEIY